MLQNIWTGNWSAQLQIFKGSTDIKGIKTAAAVWIAGAIGLSIGTGFWGLGSVVGIATAVILYITDSLSPPVRQEEGSDDTAERSYGRVEKNHAVKPMAQVMLPQKVSSTRGCAATRAE